MTQEQALAKLQSMARELSDSELRMRAQGQPRLSEYFAVWRMVNFKVQDIIRAHAREDITNAIKNLYIDIFSQMEYFRDSQITGLSELYGAAIDGFRKAENLITDYLFVNSSEH